MSGGGFGSLLGLGASLVAPMAAPELFGAEAGLGTQLLSNAALGGGIAALTGGNPFLGALAGGAGAGIRNLIGPSATYTPGGTGGVNVAGAPSGIQAAMSSPETAVAGTQAGAQNMIYNPDLLGYNPGNYAANLAATTPDLESIKNMQLGLQGTPSATPQGIAGDTSTYTSTEPRPNFGQAQTQAAPPSNDLASLDAQSKAVLPSSPANVDTTSPAAQSRLADLKQSMSQNYSDLKTWWKNLDNIDKTLIAGVGGITALYALQPKYKMPAMQTVQGPQFGLASNYARTANPTPVYPHFAEGGLAQLAQGGNLASKPANLDFMGSDMYPMSQQNTSFYATPSQMPTSAQQALASYEPKTNPLTGIPTANMARGGVVAFESGGDVYAGTPLAKALGITGVAEPGLESVYPEQYMSGIGSIRGVGGSAIKAAEEAAIRQAQRKALNRANRFATGAIREYSPEEKAAEAIRLNANVKASNPYGLTDMGTQSSVGERLVTQSREPLSGELGGSGGLQNYGSGPDYTQFVRGGVIKYADGGTAEAMQEAMANRWLSNLPEFAPTASAKGGMLKGPGDGMSDSIPGTIDGVRPARLADGEFVVPADVVSHLGNGSTDAGAKHLYKMLDRVRQARTGRKSQGKQINPARYMPA